MSDPELRFHPRPDVKVIDLAGRARCVVVDDALQAPEAIRAWAIAARDRFVAAPFNAYPGIEQPVPEAWIAALDEFFRVHVQRHSPMRRLERTTARLSLVTLPPEALQPRQWIPHRDSAWVDPTHTIAASVLYLFDAPALGGTGFYAPRLDDAGMRRLVHDASVLDAEAFAARHAVAPAYPLAGDAYFVRLGGVEAKFNRLVFYDGRLFHSGDIAHPEKMSDDPARGRLTLNGFFSGRSRAQALSS
jgi:hypothetical protein